MATLNVAVMDILSDGEQLVVPAERAGAHHPEPPGDLLPAGAR